MKFFWFAYFKCRQLAWVYKKNVDETVIISKHEKFTIFLFSFIFSFSPYSTIRLRWQIFQPNLALVQWKIRTTCKSCKSNNTGLNFILYMRNDNVVMLCSLLGTCIFQLSEQTDAAATKVCNLTNRFPSWLMNLVIFLIHPFNETCSKYFSYFILSL